MGKQIEFFCNTEEELQILEYLKESEETSVMQVCSGRLEVISIDSFESLPAWPEPLSLIFWNPKYGELKWHASEPAPRGKPHGSFLMNFFAWNSWRELRLNKKNRLLDLDRSPVLFFHRGGLMNKKKGQSLVLAPSSRTESLGEDYEKWVRRTLSWIRRRGKIVHDWREPTTSIPNYDGTRNTVYAFSGIFDDLNSEVHNYALFNRNDI